MKKKSRIIFSFFGIFLIKIVDEDDSDSDDD